MYYKLSGQHFIQQRKNLINFWLYLLPIYQFIRFRKLPKSTSEHFTIKIYIIYNIGADRYWSCIGSKWFWVSSYTSINFNIQEKQEKGLVSFHPQTKFQFSDTCQPNFGDSYGYLLSEFLENGLIYGTAATILELTDP